jgi:hypothetical protein
MRHALQPIRDRVGILSHTPIKGNPRVSQIPPCHAKGPDMTRRLEQSRLWDSHPTNSNARHMSGVLLLAADCTVLYCTVLYCAVLCCAVVH